MLFARYGITTKFADGDGVGAMGRLIDDQTRAIFCESVGNPRSNVPDIPALAALAHRHKIPLVVDNTFGACGCIARPLDLGADIVTASASKVYSVLAYILDRTPNSHGSAVDWRSWHHNGRHRR